ncbi:MAG: hypothetical protein JXA03_07150 [Bacteroidales bacterium]|nr:hypothetical protein [Bacteroidales bacterium]
MKTFRLLFLLTAAIAMSGNVFSQTTSEMEEMVGAVNDETSLTATEDTPEVLTRLKHGFPEAVGDILFEFDAQTAHGETGSLGAEFDGTYFWTTSRGLVSPGGNQIFKWDINGNFIAAYNQGTTSAWGMRDLAWDGAFLYAGDDNGFYRIDPATGGVTTLFTQPFGGPAVIRALAWVPSEGMFYTGDFGNAFYKFFPDGSGMTMVPNPGVTAVYGMAYDEINDKIWIFDQSGPTNQTTTFFEWNYSANTLTGTTYLVPVLTGLTAQTAGGAFFTAGLVPGKWVLGGLIQGTALDMVFGLETGPPGVNDVGVTAITSPVSGPLTSSEQVTIEVFNYGMNSQSDIPVHFEFDSQVYTGTVAGPVAFGTTASYTFSQTIDLSGTGPFEITACTDLVGDEEPANDCETVIVQAVSGQILLMPESTGDRVMAFDPVTGDLIDPDFIPTNAYLSTPIQAILNHDGTGILVSDQVGDVVQEFDFSGNYVGVFAPAGGANPVEINNIRGICLKPNGHLLVSVGTGSPCVNQKTVVEYDLNGNFVGVFISGVDAFDVIYRQPTDDYLVADIENPDHIKRYDNAGNFIEIITSNVNFPEQLGIASNGNILAGCFSTPQGVHEYQTNGALVGIYDIITGNRGVYELPNQNILTTNGTGVYEIDRNNALISTKVSGIQGRFISLVNLGGSASISLDIKVFLEGPFNGSTMDPDLYGAGFLPLTQPYNAAPWNYTGTENVAAIPNPNVIDWVLIDLRDAADAASATPATTVARQACFLLADGSIVGLDGSSLPEFGITIANNLFAVIWHRNHLAVMSANPLPEAGGVYSYDFSTSSAQVYGGVLGYEELAPGIWGMMGGDGDSDGQVGNPDKVDVWTVDAGNAGYLFGDFNLDGQANNPDKVEVWEPNSGSGSQVPN